MQDLLQLLSMMPVTQAAHLKAIVLGSLCSIHPAFQKPLPMVCAGIGFEDCSARLTPIPDQQFQATHTFMAQHEPPEPAAWSFYSFNVSRDDYQIVINAAGESNKDDCEPPSSPPHKLVEVSVVENAYLGINRDHQL